MRYFPFPWHCTSDATVNKAAAIAALVEIT